MHLFHFAGGTFISRLDSHVSADNLTCSVSIPILVSICVLLGLGFEFFGD